MPLKTKLETTRAAVRAFRSRVVAVPLTAEDDALLAAQYDAERGYDRPLELRMKEAFQDVLDAPMIIRKPSAPRRFA